MGLCHFAVRKHVDLPYDDALSVATAALIRSATTFDVSRGFQFSTYALKAIFRAIHRLYSDRPLQLDTEREGAKTWTKDFVVSHDVEMECGADELWAMLRLIDPADAELIRGRFGLDTGKPKTLDAIGVEMGISKERVRQRQNAILRQLKAMIQEDL